MVEMDIFSFGVEFGNEEDCILYFKKERDKIGVSCKQSTPYVDISQLVEIHITEKSTKKTPKTP